MYVVEIHDAVRGHAVALRRQEQFGHESASGSGQSGYHNGTDPIGNRIASQDENRTVSPLGSGEPDFTLSHLSNPTSPLQLPSLRLSRVPTPLR